MYSKSIYHFLLLTITILLAVSYIPEMNYLKGLLTPAMVLFTGLLFAFFFKNPYPTWNKKISKYLLQYAVVGLGFGMNVQDALQSGRNGILFSILSVVITLWVGYWIGKKWLKNNKKVSYLISAGTAICGGSAIAAIAPLVKSEDRENSVALGTVFILNAVALFIFPLLGHYLQLSQSDFGTWAAIAIHDTSSVVGAGNAYGEEALEVATTVKLTRALWIIPLTIFTAFAFKAKGEKIAIPWFIIWFILAMLINTYLLQNYPSIGQFIKGLAQKVLTVTMFFIGASLSRESIKSVGFKPFLQGILLWLFISVAALCFVYYT